MNWFTKIKKMCGFGENTTSTSADYSAMKVAELKAIAKERGVKGYYKLRRAELISTLDHMQ
jgi:large subunit ribosomal protein L21